MERQLYDRALKSLMEDHAAEMLPELLPGAHLVSVENVEINRPNLRADLVYLIKLHGVEHILNLELQTDNDSDMNFRMLKYNVELYDRYRMPVVSMVMYPFETVVSEPVFRVENLSKTALSFDYQILRLWLEEAEECFHRGVVSMYTLLPAMKGVTVPMLFQAIVAMEQRYPHPHLERHLLRFRTILRRSKTLSMQEKQQVEGKLKTYDSLLESDPELQKEIQEKAEASKIAGRLEGKAEGKLEGKIEGKIEGRQQAVLDIVEIKFPALLKMAQEQIVHLNDTSNLSLLTKQIILAPDEQTARWALSTFAA